MAVHCSWVLCIALFVLTKSSSADLCEKLTKSNETVPYVQIYPRESAALESWEAPTSDGKTPLYFALILSFGGQFLSSGAIPGVQVALDQINSNASILPGYELRYTLIESLCERTLSITTFFDQVLSEPTKIAVIGSGCSVATEPTAEISYFYNLNQELHSNSDNTEVASEYVRLIFDLHPSFVISCVSSSPALANRNRFKYHYQILINELNNAYGFYSIIRQYQWERVAILVQDENLFTQPMALLRSLLLENSTINEENLMMSSFRTEDGLSSLGQQILHPDARIFILAMYAGFARDILCKAAEMGLKYPHYTFIVYGWYAKSWWDPTKDTTFNCTSSRKEMMEVVQYMLAPLIVQFYEESSSAEPLDTGMYGRDYSNMYRSHLTKSLLNDRCSEELQYNNYAQPCYDATWSLAVALNKSMNDLSSFTYDDRSLRETLFQHLNNTDIKGLTGPVRFNANGSREINKLVILQYRVTDDGEVERVEIGDVIVQGGDAHLQYHNENDSTVWPGGIPFDGVFQNVIVTVLPELTVIYIIFVVAGIIFAVVCLIFNFTFRNRKLIRLTSPKLNYMIGVGAIIFYIDVALLVTPSTNSSVVSGLCNATLWLAPIGYSLCFGPILAKMIRVYYIFSNPAPRKKVVIKDWLLMAIVFLFVLVDILILTVYTAVDGALGHLAPIRVPRDEHPRDVLENTLEGYEYSIYVCTSKARQGIIGLLYGYKALIQAMTLIFAFSIRKVKVKGLDDSKYVGASVYIISIVLAVTVVTSYTLPKYVNEYEAVFGIGLLIGATIVLILAFVPKMVALYQDPEGATIFEKSEFQAVTIPTPGDSSESVDTLKSKVTQLEQQLSQQECLIKTLEKQISKDVDNPLTCGAIQPSKTPVL